MFGQPQIIIGRKIDPRGRTQRTPEPGAIEVLQTRTQAAF
jgi:hypothetical protein